jgi:hypothetical protein
VNVRPNDLVLSSPMKQRISLAHHVSSVNERICTYRLRFIQATDVPEGKMTDSVAQPSSRGVKSKGFVSIWDGEKKNMGKSIKNWRIERIDMQNKHGLPLLLTLVRSHCVIVCACAVTRHMGCQQQLLLSHRLSDVTDHLAPDFIFPP